MSSVTRQLLNCSQRLPTLFYSTISSTVPYRQSTSLRHDQIDFKRNCPKFNSDVACFNTHQGALHGVDDVDKHQLPELNEEDLEEQFIKGSGPGGQSVNKTVNCVLLKHTPTGTVIKSHESRSLDTNRKLARIKMQEKLDLYYNKEESLKMQEKLAASRMKKEKRAKTNKKLEKLRAFKEREGIT